MLWESSKAVTGMCSAVAWSGVQSVSAEPALGGWECSGCGREVSRGPKEGVVPGACQSSDLEHTRSCLLSLGWDIRRNKWLYYNISLPPHEKNTQICKHLDERQFHAFNFLLPGLNKPSLGQHCFIKSIQAESEVSWCKMYVFDGNYNLFLY